MQPPLAPLMMLLFVGKMLKSASPQYPNRGSDARVIRLTTDQEAVLQEQFNRWPRAPHTADIVLLAAETGLSEADVEVFILFSEKRKYLKNIMIKRKIFDILFRCIFQAWYSIRLAQWRKEQGLGGNLGLH